MGSTNSLAGYEQHRNVVTKDLRNPGEGVLDTRPTLHRKHPDAFAVGRPADAVRDPGPHALLTADRWPDADCGARID